MWTLKTFHQFIRVFCKRFREQLLEIVTGSAVYDTKGKTGTKCLLESYFKEVVYDLVDHVTNLGKEEHESIVDAEICMNL